MYRRRAGEFVTSFRFFLFSTGWDFESVFVSVGDDTFTGRGCRFDRILASGLCLAGGECDLASFPGDEWRSSFGFFFGGSGVRAASLVSDPLSAAVSSFLASLAAIDRAFPALCF